MTVNVGPRDRIVRAIITVAALIGAVSVGISSPLGSRGR